MPFQPAGLDSTTLKRLSQRLRKGFAQQFPDTPCSPHQAQAMLAHMLGHASWHAALQASSIQPVVRSQEGGHAPQMHLRHELRYEFTWAKEVVPPLFIEYGSNVAFELAGMPLLPREVLDPTGFFPMLLTHLAQEQAPHLLQDGTLLFARDSLSILDMVACVQERLLPAAWSTLWVGQRLSALLRTLPVNAEGLIVLDELYQRFADLANQNGLRWVQWEDGSVGGWFGGVMPPTQTMHQAVLDRVELFG